MIQKFAILMISLAITVTASAETYAGYSERAHAILNQVSAANQKTIDETGAVEAEAYKAFHTAFRFVVDVAEDAHLTEEEQAILIETVGEKIGSLVTVYSEEYQDLPPYRYSPSPYDSKVSKAFQWSVAQIRFYALGVSRDFLSIFKGTALPFVGNDSKRSATLAKMGADIERALKDFEQGAKGTQQVKGLSAVYRILAKMEESEVMQNGRANTRMRRLYLGVAFFSLFVQPPIETFFSLGIESTQFSPLVAGINWALLAWAFNGARARNSGERFAYHVRQVATKIQKIQTSLGIPCSRILTGKK